MRLAGRLVAAVLAVGFLATTAACTGSPHFKSGDCVKIRPHLLDHSLDRASCEPGRFLDPNDVTYRVTNVINGTDGRCNFSGDMGNVEFTDEPDDAVYCLAPVYS